MEGEVENRVRGSWKQARPSALVPALEGSTKPKSFTLAQPPGMEQLCSWSHPQALLPPVCSSIPRETAMGPAKVTAGQCHVPWLHTPLTTKTPQSEHPLPSLGTRITSGSLQLCRPPAPHPDLPLYGPFCKDQHKQLLNSPKSQLERCCFVAHIVSRSPGIHGHVYTLPSPTTADKEQQTPPELKKGEVSHQISPSEGEMWRKERDNEPQAPPWILLSKEEFQQQTHMYKELPAWWLSALASHSSALQLLAVGSPV